MEIRKPAVIVVATAMVILIGAVGFLLGRESTRGSAAPAPVPVAPAPASAVVAPAPPPPPAPVAAPPPAPAPVAVAPSPAPVAPVAPVAPPAPAPTVAKQPTDAVAVRDYFARVAAIQASGPSGDPTELANRVLAAAMQGDSSGFDDLVHAAEAGAARVRALSVPAACAQYQRDLLALMKDSLDMLRTLRSAITAQNTDALAGIAGSAGALQSRADALAKEEARIRASVGSAE